MSCDRNIPVGCIFDANIKNNVLEYDQYRFTDPNRFDVTIACHGRAKDDYNGRHMSGRPINHPELHGISLYKYSSINEFQYAPNPGLTLRSTLLQNKGVRYDFGMGVSGTGIHQICLGEPYGYNGNLRYSVCDDTPNERLFSQGYISDISLGYEDIPWGGEPGIFISDNYSQNGGGKPVPGWLYSNQFYGYNLGGWIYGKPLFEFIRPMLRPRYLSEVLLEIKQMLGNNADIHVHLIVCTPYTAVGHFKKTPVKDLVQLLPVKHTHAKVKLLYEAKLSSKKKASAKVKNKI